MRAVGGHFCYFEDAVADWCFDESQDIPGLSNVLISLDEDELGFAGHLGFATSCVVWNRLNCMTCMHAALYSVFSSRISAHPCVSLQQ